MTTLTATYSAGSPGVAPPRVLLQVAAAPSIAAVYTQNTAASVDGWATAGSGTLAFNVAPNAGLKLTNTTTGGAGFAWVTFTRTFTGLTIGTAYRWTVPVSKGTLGGATARLAVTGMTAGSTLAVPATGRAVMTYDFTATATSHVGEVRVRTGHAAVPVDCVVDSMTVRPGGAWLGTTIRRTDANGTSVVVRENDGGQDTTGVSGSATMTVTDYEAALTGTVSYTVTDGAGGTANATVGAPTAPGVWLTLPATSVPGTPVPPAFIPVGLITGYGSTRPSSGTVHQIIGRADPVANPGPLTTRQGRLVLWCSTYADADAVEVLLSSGATAQLRQQDYPGMDMYFTGRSVGIDPAGDTSPTRWAVSVEFQEVAAP